MVSDCWLAWVGTTDLGGVTVELDFASESTRGRKSGGKRIVRRIAPDKSGGTTREKLGCTRQPKEPAAGMVDCELPARAQRAPPAGRHVVPLPWPAGSRRFAGGCFTPAADAKLTRYATPPA